MIKKILTSDLRMGMFVQKLDGAWIEHPFWRAKFTLETTDQFDRLKLTSAGIWIDGGTRFDIDTRLDLQAVNPARARAIRSARSLVAA